MKREGVSTALETQAVISKPRPNPRIRRFLATVHNAGLLWLSTATGRFPASRSTAAGFFLNSDMLIVVSAKMACIIKLLIRS